MRQQRWDVAKLRMLWLIVHRFLCEKDNNCDLGWEENNVKIWDNTADWKPKAKKTSAQINSKKYPITFLNSRVSAETMLKL